jgi:uncharacterized membrane protein
MNPKELIGSVEQNAIVAAIREAESRCSGEIRVHVEPSLRGRDIRFVGERTFERLGMTKTALRNGVLLFIAAKEQQFIVLGDSGIHEKAGDDFWKDVASAVADEFRSGRFTEGIVAAVRRAGEKLAEHFPHASGDRDELPNEVSLGGPDDG